MTDISSVTKKDRPLYKSIITALLGIIPAAALILATLNNQSYLRPILLVSAIFIFPVSVLCGLVSGLFSPRKTIVWAPVWACIASPLLMAGLSGAIHDTSITHSAWRFAWILGGIIVAGLSALVVEIAVQRGRSAHILGIFILGCLTLSAVELQQINQTNINFEREIVPQIISEVNTNYMAVPKSNEWHCIRKPAIDSYELSNTVNDGKFVVIVSATDKVIAGISYHYIGSNASIKTDKSAKQYLKRFGFKNELLKSLSMQDKYLWTASLERISLTLSHNGEIRITTLPPVNDDLPSRTQE